jgi:hypothetical protein
MALHYNRKSSLIIFMLKCENHYFCGLLDCAKMQTRKKLKVLKNDNGGEFVSKEFENSRDLTLKVCTL